MSKVDSAAAFDDADAIFESWRGRCVNTFARGEDAIGRVLETARSAGHDVRLQHLAGQRLKALRDLSDRLKATEPQRKAWQIALDAWQALDEDRAYLAHGVMITLRDRRGNNFLRQSMTVYKSDKADRRERLLPCDFTGEFEERLKRAYADLRRELGQFRKRLNQPL
ncbi:MAG: hypothetical protein KGL48_00695 [Sphingomonadales bacterium]|nr:hypothetical protein [Sphingomonadales bacterium]MDE2567832.1 hypothetical protein [Sphingomonadales bacterium]